MNEPERQVAVDSGQAKTPERAPGHRELKPPEWFEERLAAWGQRVGLGGLAIPTAYQTEPARGQGSAAGHSRHGAEATATRGAKHDPPARGVGRRSDRPRPGAYRRTGGDESRPKALIERAQRRARVKWNVAPFPTSPSAQVRPPCLSTILRTLARPTPVPANSLEWRRRNGWNNVSL